MMCLCLSEEIGGGRASIVDRCCIEGIPLVKHRLLESHLAVSGVAFSYSVSAFPSRFPYACEDEDQQEKDTSESEEATPQVNWGEAPRVRALAATALVGADTVLTIAQVCVFRHWLSRVVSVAGATLL